MYFIISDQTERDIENINEEIRYKMITAKQIQKQCDRISTKKYQLEKQFLEELENQAANDTVGKA